MTSRRRTFLGIVAAFVLVPESFIGPVLVLFYTTSLGFSFHEMTLFFSLILIAKCTTEIPAGLLSDRYGRKAMLVLGEILAAGAMLGLLLLPESKYFLLVLGILWGIGNSLSSGNLYPIIQDALESMNLGERLPKILSYGQSASYCTMFGAGVAAGYIGEHDLSLPFKIDIAILVAYTLLIALCLPESKGQKASHNLFESFKASFANADPEDFRRLAIVLVIGALVPAVERSNFNFLQPILTTGGLEIWQLGYISSGMFLVGAAGGLIYGKFSANARLKNGLVLISCALCIAAATSMLYFQHDFPSWTSITIFSANALLASVFGLLVTNSILAIAGPKSDFRTTIFSVLSFLSAVFSATIQSAAGYWQQYTPQTSVVAYCTIGMSVAVVAYQLAVNSPKQINAQQCPYPQ